MQHSFLKPNYQKYPKQRLGLLLVISDHNYIPFSFSVKLWFKLKILMARESKDVVTEDKSNIIVTSNLRMGLIHCPILGQIEYATRISILNSGVSYWSGIQKAQCFIFPTILQNTEYLILISRSIYIWKPTQQGCPISYFTTLTSYKPKENLYNKLYKIGTFHNKQYKIRTFQNLQKIIKTKQKIMQVFELTKADIIT